MKEKFITDFKEALEMEEGTQVKLEDNFRDYEDWDSLARLQLIAMLDEKYEVEIEEKDFENLKMVGDLLNTVQERQNS